MNDMQDMVARKLVRMEKFRFCSMNERKLFIASSALCLQAILSLDHIQLISKSLLS